jgi:hypothetical protein
MEVKRVYHPVYDYLGITPTFSLEYLEQINYNEYKVKTEGETVTCFKKYIPLVDYVKYLIGKYKGDTLTLPSTSTPDGLFQEAIQSCHNYAYVDSFFYYMTSLLRDRGFVHGLKVYDSYLCVQKNIEINVADDFEYICDSNYFNEKLNHLFYFKDENVFAKKENSPINNISEKVPMACFLAMLRNLWSIGFSVPCR